MPIFCVQVRWGDMPAPDVLGHVILGGNFVNPLVTMNYIVMYGLVFMPDPRNKWNVFPWGQSLSKEMFHWKINLDLTLCVPCVNNGHLMG